MTYINITYPIHFHEDERGSGLYIGTDPKGLDITIIDDNGKAASFELTNLEAQLLWKELRKVTKER